ncbi:MAG TPA: hypothetical protein VF950_16290 [Planctomycetota bacterium]
MLFANPAVRDFIAENFTPAWETVRDVPTVTIDFGGGRTLKRTVNGNVATYICAPDGRVVDLLPGLSTPEAYLQDLRAAVALLKRSPEEVAAHHRARVALPVRSAGLDAGKVMGIEPRVKKAIGVDRAKVEGIEPRVKTAILDSDRALLEADTLANRQERRPKIHALLAERSWTSRELTKRVYRDILNCDLDDPYLGLGEAAFGGGAYGSR